MSRPNIRTIESPHNDSLKVWKKNIQHPEDPSFRCIPLEGPKQISDLAVRLSPELLVVSADAIEKYESLLACAAEVVQLPNRLMDRLSDVRTSQGVIAFVRKPDFEWPDLPDQILYLDGLQDPGNLGTILRTAAAAGGWGLVTAPGTVSCFNSKVIRASAGYLIEVPFLERREPTEVSERGYSLWTADSASGIDLFSAGLEAPLCVVVGREGGGFSDSLPASVHRLHIPMEPGVESLNAAVSAALILYEVRRRRSCPDRRQPAVDSIE